MSNPDEAKTEEEATSDQLASVDETNATTEESTEEESQEELTAEEIAKLKKKADDFDKAVELQRISKLAAKGESSEAEAPKVEGEGTNSNKLSAEDIKNMVAEGIKIGVRNANKPVYEENLKKAYRRFISENKWADNDAIIARLSQNFDSNDAITESQLFSRLISAAESSYPDKYKEAQESRIRAEVLTESENIEAGDVGGGSGSGQPSSAITPKRKLNAKEQKFLDAMGVKKK